MDLLECIEEGRPKKVAKLNQTCCWPLVVHLTTTYYSHFFFFSSFSCFLGLSRKRKRKLEDCLTILFLSPRTDALLLLLLSPRTEGPILFCLAMPTELAAAAAAFPASFAVAVDRDNCRSIRRRLAPIGGNGGGIALESVAAAADDGGSGDALDAAATTLEMRGGGGGPMGRGILRRSSV